jgi:hypothetical protein
VEPKSQRLLLEPFRKCQIGFVHVDIKILVRAQCVINALPRNLRTQPSLNQANHNCKIGKVTNPLITTIIITATLIMAIIMIATINIIIIHPINNQTDLKLDQEIGNVLVDLIIIQIASIA